MKKAIVVSATVLTIALLGTPIFAQHWNNQVPAQQTRQTRMSERHNDGGHGQCGMDGMFGGRMNGGDNVKVGTVTLVDVKNSAITVTDSDGKTFKVSVNPRTVLNDSTEVLAQRNALRANPPAAGTNYPVWISPKVISLADVKAGDWVSVNYLNTGTATLDAARIQTVKK